MSGEFETPSEAEIHAVIDWGTAFQLPPTSHESAKDLLEAVYRARRPAAEGLEREKLSETIMSLAMELIDQHKPRAAGNLLAHSIILLNGKDYNEVRRVIESAQSVLAAHGDGG